MLVIKDLFRGMMLKSKESYIKIAGHSKCLAISCTPAMGNSLVVKVHYTLGSRKC